MSEVGCYAMDLYCDDPNHKEASSYGFPPPSLPLDEFTGYTRGECIKQAREVGWRFHRNRTITCPICLGRWK